MAIGNCLPVYTTSHPETLEFSMAPLRKPQILHKGAHLTRTVTELTEVDDGTEENSGFWK
jgi:hypothetical protein